MTIWTEENTEGFTAADLAELNAAQAKLEAQHGAELESAIADKLNNAWTEGATAAELIARVSFQ
jgi:hypothetical protein